MKRVAPDPEFMMMYRKGIATSKIAAIVSLIQPQSCGCAGASTAKSGQIQRKVVTGRRSFDGPARV